MESIIIVCFVFLFFYYQSGEHNFTLCDTLCSLRMAIKVSLKFCWVWVFKLKLNFRCYYFFIKTRLGAWMESATWRIKTKRLNNWCTLLIKDEIFQKWLQLYFTEGLPQMNYLALLRLFISMKHSIYHFLATCVAKYISNINSTYKDRI